MATEWIGQEEAHDEGVAMALGERIRELRKEQRLSQGDLATKIGADPGQISRYENGHISPSADAIVRLAEALDVSCDYLLVDDALRRPFRSPVEDALGENLAAIAELDDDDVKSVQNFVDALATKRPSPGLGSPGSSSPTTTTPPAMWLPQRSPPS